MVISSLHLVLNLSSFYISQFFVNKLFKNHENISNNNKKKILYFLISMAVLFALYYAMSLTVNLCISIMNGGES